MNGSSTGPDDKTTVTVTIDTTAKIGGIVGSNRDKYAARPGQHNDFIFIVKKVVSTPWLHSYRAYYDDPVSNKKLTFNYYLSECNPDKQYDMLIITTDYFDNGLKLVELLKVFNYLFFP